MSRYTTPRRWWGRVVLAGVVFALVFAAVPPVAATPPPPPAAYYGELTADGEPIPAGVTITAMIDGEVRGELTTADAGRYGGSGAFDPKLQVDGTSDDEGATVRFYVDGVEANQTVQWEAGDIQAIDLTVGGDAVDDGAESPGGSGGAPDGGTSGDDEDSNGAATPPSVNVTPTSDGVDAVVTGARAGVPVSIDVNGDANDGVALDGLNVTPIVDGNFTLSISVGQTPPTAGEAFSVAEAGDPLGYVTIDHTIADDDIDAVRFRFRVTDSRLADRWLEPDAVSLYRLHDGAWTELSTRHTGTSGAIHTFEADSPGLSVFAIAPRADDRDNESPTESDPDSQAGTEDSDGTEDPDRTEDSDETEDPSETEDSDKTEDPSETEDSDKTENPDETEDQNEADDHSSNDSSSYRTTIAVGLGAALLVVALFWFRVRR